MVQSLGLRAARHNSSWPCGVARTSPSKCRINQQRRPPWLLGAMPVFRIPERTVPSLHGGSIGSSRRICTRVSGSKSHKREGYYSATNIIPAANPLFYHSGKQGTNRSLSCCKCPFSPRKSPPCTESDHTGSRVRRAEGRRTLSRARIRRRTARPETSTTMVST